MKYVIESKTYEKHINDEVHLYGLLHQLTFLAGKVKDADDMANLIETAKHYGEIAEEKFDDWLIPGRFLVFGDRKDLTELKAAELTPLTDVLKAHDRERAEKERTAETGDPAYVISGSSFRLLVGDLFALLAQYGFLRNRILMVKTERQLVLPSVHSANHFISTRSHSSPPTCRLSCGSKSCRYTSLHRRSSA